MNRNRNRYGRWLRLATFLALAGVGVWLLAGSVLLGVPVLLAGLAGSIYQGVRMWQERPDPYDLSRIWDEAPDPEVPEDANRDLDVVLCRCCGLGVSNEFKVCPECGHVLGR